MGIFSKKPIFTEYEQKLLNLIQVMCNLKDTSVIIHYKNVDCYIVNEQHGYKIIIHSTGVNIQDPQNYSEEKFGDTFITRCKDFAIARDTFNRDEIKESSSARKNKTLDDMLSKMSHE